MTTPSSQGDILEQPPPNTAQDGSIQDSQITALNAPLFTRVQKPDGSDGSVYDIEVIAQTPGVISIPYQALQSDLSVLSANRVLYHQE